MTREIRRFVDLEALSQAALSLVADLARESVAARGRFTLSLAGGRTPRLLYRLLAQAAGEMPWEGTHLFWGDERCVPPDSSDSNFALVRDTIIGHAPVPAENIHRIPAELDPPEDAAALYERTLQGFFGEKGPTFDLTLLGVGDDGHTASLFPGDPALEERERWVLAVRAPAGILPERRITLTLPVLDRSRVVLFLTAARRKRDIVNEILREPRASRDYPAARVAAPRLLWYVAGEPA